MNVSTAMDEESRKRRLIACKSERTRAALLIERSYESQQNLQAQSAEPAHPPNDVTELQEKPSTLEKDLKV